MPLILLIAGIVPAITSCMRDFKNTIKVTDKLEDLDGMGIEYLVSSDFAMDMAGNVTQGYIRVRFENGSMYFTKFAGNTDVTKAA